MPALSNADGPPDHPTRYCRKCRYVLDGLTVNRCPECGQAFDLVDAGTYIAAQCDDDFVAACGYTDDSEAARRAVVLRNELAQLGSVEAQTLPAEATIISTGVIHPTDSLNLLEFSLDLQGVTGAKRDWKQLSELLGPESESLTVSEWVRRMIS